MFDPLGRFRPRKRKKPKSLCRWWSVAGAVGLAGLLLTGVFCARQSPSTPVRIGLVPLAADSTLADRGLDDVVSYAILWRLSRVPDVQVKPVFLSGTLDRVRGTATLRRRLASDTTLLRIGLRAGLTCVAHGKLHTDPGDSVTISLRAVNVPRRRQTLNEHLTANRDSLVLATAKLALDVLTAAGISPNPDVRARVLDRPCKNPRAFAFFARAEMMRLHGGNAFQPEKYQEWIERASELDMDFFDAAQRLAELDLQRGDFRAAILALTNATRIRPDWVDGYNQLASVLGAYQAPDKVIEVSRKALHYDPDNLPALANLGAAYLDKAMPDSAIFYLDRALQSDPENWRLIYNLGVAYARKRDWKRSLALLRQALNKRSDVPEIHYFLGLAYNNLGMPGEAVRWFQRAAKLDPHGPFGKRARKHLKSILGYVPGDTK